VVERVLRHPLLSGGNSCESGGNVERRHWIVFLRELGGASGYSCALIVRSVRLLSLPSSHRMPLWLL
jgi:hypothetical protein